jgi:NADPH-dependent F420 reductase
MEISIIGGTGEEGFGLTLRLAKAGNHVTIGSRSQEKGEAAAAKARGLVGDDAKIDGTTNEQAAASAEVVVVTVPFEGQAQIYRSIKAAVPAGTIVVDCTNPLATAVGGLAWHVLRPWHGSAAEQAKAILDPGVRLVGAFHTISGDSLQDLEHDMDSDVLVCGDGRGCQGVHRNLARIHPERH